ncbi:MAG: alpha/beta hydrolase [Bosea sp.]|nr:alpha/beta hydrolase [Bosea sp. (in: a-proteobacteria)]
MPFVRTSDDVALHYSDWGSGQPVLLIHGWPLTAEMWEYQASALVDAGYRVISYDRRGFGRSDRPWSRYDYDRLADDLDSLIRHLDLRDIVLVGFSMGGGEVARFLSRHGAARVAGAALIAAVTPCLARHPDNPHGLDRAVFDGLAAALSGDRIGFLAGYAETVFRPGTDPVVAAGLKAWYLSMALPASGPATLATARAWYETDFRPDMSAFTVPTLILHGAQDQSVPAAIAGRAAASLIPGARYVEYAEAGHFLPVDEKTRVTADLLAFLNGLRRSEPSAP